MAELIPLKRALISVSDKTDLVPFARRLARHGVQLISTGGTARAIADAGLEVTPVDQVTGFPEMMDGRLKTLHPRVHGALLALRDEPSHVQAMAEHGIEPIDLVCVNLYPFEQTIERDDVSEQEAVEQIDIGGPSMIRSAAKNHGFVAVVTCASQYDRVCNDLEKNDGATSLVLRRWLATAAFARTAAYDTAISTWMTQNSARTDAQSTFADPLILRFTQAHELRYGENPHQRGALYLEPAARDPGVARARQLHGKALSFCNLFDADAALELVKEIDGREHAAAAVIKHANPCGFAVADNLARAFDKAYQGDPLAAFGGIVACNRKVDAATALSIVGIESFVEVIVAPGYDDEALETLQQRWKNTRLLEVGDLWPPSSPEGTRLDFKRITGGLLVQQRDVKAIDASGWQHMAGPAPDPDVLGDALVATIAVKHLKSNAISLAKGGMLVGAGAGQMDRLASCDLAVKKAGDRASGCVAGSDAFFPFRDGPDRLIDAGIRAIVQPGGSKRDDQTLEACTKAGVTLLHTGRRLFRH